MQATFFQMEGYVREGRQPRDNHIRGVAVNDTDVAFICTTVPGDTDLSRVFLRAGLHPAESSDVIRLPKSEFTRGMDALLELGEGGNSKAQLSFLTRIRAMCPSL